MQLEKYKDYIKYEVAKCLLYQNRVVQVQV